MAGTVIIEDLERKDGYGGSMVERVEVNLLARMLSGYGDVTWNKLNRNRKLTYIRAASTLLFDWEKIKEFVERP
jgi:hypothetical protein